MTKTLVMIVGLSLALPACQKLEPINKHEDNESPAKGTASTVSPAPATKSAPRPQPPRPGPPAKPPELYSGAHILLAYKGASRAGPDVTRSKEDALKLAKELAAKARKNPKAFAEMAKKHSNGPSNTKGGSLGAWPKGRMVPAFDQAIGKLKMNDVSDPVETPFGYHVIIRKTPWLAGAHILVAYKGSARAKADITRTKEEALKQAKQLAARAAKDPTQFAEMAKKHSDGPSGPKGGSLGKWPRGRMVPAFDIAIDGLEVGGVSKPVETQFGFHVITRYDPEKVKPPQ